MFMSCQRNTGQTQHKTAHKSLKNMAIFISSDKPKLRSRSNLRADNIQGTHANTPFISAFLSANYKVEGNNFSLFSME